MADTDDVATSSTETIGSLFDNIMGILKCLLHDMKNCGVDAKPQPDLHYRALERIIATLFFWDHDLQVSCGNLDKSLQHSGFLRETVLTVLVAIARHIRHSE